MGTSGVNFHGLECWNCFNLKQFQYFNVWEEGRKSSPLIKTGGNIIFISADRIGLLEDLARDLLDELAELKAPLMENCKCDDDEIMKVYAPCYVVKAKGGADNTKSSL